MTIFARKTQPHTIKAHNDFSKCTTATKGDVMVSGAADKEEVVLISEGVSAKRKREKASDLVT